MRRDDITALVCMRVRDVGDRPRIAGSTQERCSACREAVWVSPKSREAAGPDAVFVCVPCAQRLIAPGDTLLPDTPAQRREIDVNRRRN